MAAGNRKIEPGNQGRLLTGRDLGQKRLHFAAGQIISAQGNLPDALFYIEYGQVKLAVVSPAGKEAVIGVRGEGDFFGVRSLSGDQLLATVTALVDCTIIRIETSTMSQMLRENPDFHALFIGFLLRQHFRDQENLIDQLTNSAERRLARVLLQLAGSGRPGKPNTIPINQTELANMIGTTRSRVSSFMNKFRRKGFIEYSREGFVTVHDALRKQLAD